MKAPLTALIFSLLLSSFAAGRPGHTLEHQLVTVRVTSQSWNEYRPWQKYKPQTRTFIGTVLDDHRILMITDDLDDATLIQVQKYDRPPRVPARIVHRDDQVGLAIITVDEPGFFDELQPTAIADRCEGGDYYCATWMSGQLSLAACRWSKATIYNSNLPYLNIVRAFFITDLTSGGWGEPIFSGNKLVGISTSQNETTVQALTAEQIRAYLQATEQPKYPGFAWLGVRYQYNKGFAQAAYFGQEGKPTGVRIRSCFPGSSADGILLTDDLLLELDGHKIDSLGDYVHPHYGPLDLGYIANEGHFAGDVITAKVLRNKEELTVEIPLKNMPASAALIPEDRLSTPPPYLMAGGLVFRELDVPYLQAWGKDWEASIPSYLRTLFKLQGESPTPEQQRLIILADVFPDEYNLGYHDLSQKIVKSVNGDPIDSIKKMEQAFQHPLDGFHVIEFMPCYGMNKVILDAAHFDEATSVIMEKYQIPARIRFYD
jgi:hypothetical protein